MVILLKNIFICSYSLLLAIVYCCAAYFAQKRLEIIVIPIQLPYKAGRIYRSVSACQNYNETDCPKIFRNTIVYKFNYMIPVRLIFLHMYYTVLQRENQNGIYTLHLFCFSNLYISLPSSKEMAILPFIPLHTVLFFIIERSSFRLQQIPLIPETRYMHIFQALRFFSKNIQFESIFLKRDMF